MRSEISSTLHCRSAYLWRHPTDRQQKPGAVLKGREAT